MILIRVSRYIKAITLPNVISSTTQTKDFEMEPSILKTNKENNTNPRYRSISIIFPQGIE